MKALSLIVGIIIVGGAAWFFFGREPEAASEPIVTPVEVDKNIEVIETDIAETGQAVPLGFPESIPVESNNITESVRVAYKEQGVTQYTVSYTSMKSRESLWDLYSGYMGKAGFTVDKTTSSKSLGQLSGNKGNDTLSVAISDHGGVALVQLNYLER